MPSSPIPAVAANPGTGGELWRVLHTVPDPRARRGRRHRLPVIMACALAAVLAGARSFVAIGEWTAHQSPQALDRLGVVGVVPGESTIRRMLGRLDGDLFDQLIGALMWTRTATVAGRRLIAIDGKTVRGARGKTESAQHLVAALDQRIGTVLGQVAVAAKSNEIPAVRRLLGLFHLAGVVVSVDAMHTQTDTAKLIVDAKADYVFTVKGNQPTLFSQLKALPWAKVPAHTSTQKGHGRRATRTIKVVDAPAWVEFAGAAQIAQVRRTTSKAGKKTVEVVYLITSAGHAAASPAVLASWIQGHWSIENQLHWVRDVTFDEDRSQVRIGNAPQVMATLRSVAISILRIMGWTNIAAGLRHHARNADHTLNLVLTW